MKKLKPFDYVLIAGVIILAVVFVLVLAHKNKIFSKSPVEATKKIASVFFIVYNYSFFAAARTGEAVNQGSLFSYGAMLPPFSIQNG